MLTVGLYVPLDAKPGKEGELAARRPATCSQHYRILRQAGLIFCERKGVELFSRVRTRELSARFPGLLRSILSGYERRR